MRKMCVIISGIIITLILPVFFLQNQNDSMVRDYIESRMIRFTAEAMRNRRIDAMNYNALCNEIASTGKNCSVLLEHLVSREVMVASGNNDYIETGAVVVGIIAGTGYIETELNKTPDFDIYILYSDGSRKKTDVFTSDFDSGQSGLQYVHIEYLGFTTGIEVYVKTEYICDICGNVSTRDIRFETGCDICRNTPVSLMVSPDYIEVLQGEIPEITVLVNYMDGHVELTEKWTGYPDTSIPGERKVNIGYGGILSEITINVIEKRTDDSNPDDDNNDSFDEEKENPEEEKEPDDIGSKQEDNPENQENFDFSGSAEVEKVSCITYSEQILRSIFENGVYELEKGDYISIRIRENPTKITDMDIMFGIDKYIDQTYGGRI